MFTRVFLVLAIG